MSEPIDVRPVLDLRPLELIIALDLYEQIQKTKQTYIVGHDVPVSISRPVYAYLDDKRKEIAQKLGVPEVELEFEDAVAILCGFFDLLKPRATPEVLQQANVQIARWVK